MLRLMVLCAVCYVLGSISFGLLVSHCFGLSDPRKYGSKNIGATNVMRSGHRFAAVLTLVGDLAKGTAAVALAGYLWHSSDLLPYSENIVMGLAAGCVFLGHLYPVFHPRSGGKGVATALGILLYMNPIIASAVLAIWISIVVLSGISSLAALGAAGFAPVFFGIHDGFNSFFVVLVFISLLLVWRHRMNIQRLLDGEEQPVQSPSDG